MNILNIDCHIDLGYYDIRLNFLFIEYIYIYYCTNSLEVLALYIEALL